MKFHSIFQEKINCTSPQDVFNYLKNNLTDSITTWDYFVNWQKVISNFEEIEIHLHTLNYLIGKNDIEAKLKNILQQNPRIMIIIPLLIACREESFQILTDYTNSNLKYQDFRFSNRSIPGVLTSKEIDEVVQFTKETGLLDILKNRTIKSIPDYVLGIEVGLDSNGRKNRGGNTMEVIVEEFVKSICKSNSWNYIKQATADKISEDWSITVKVDKSNRRFDFAINNQGLLYLIEVNFYGGGGSKLKATAGEYKTLFDDLSVQNHKFIWITDGLGWKTALKSLEETFYHIDYILNLNMISTGLFNEIIKQRL
ncbi:MAG: type II restriction endonuclease [Nostocaceae cyanobacterium]|nr:type II restriction endonuclease [Nostocaceae cyanobacterium]